MTDVVEGGQRRIVAIASQEMGGDGVLGTTSLLGLRCKLFEVPSRYGQQFGNTGQIPVGVGRLGMSDVGR